MVIHSLTSSADNGDFNKIVAENIGVMLGGDPVILVVKKNSHLLGNLLKWVLHVAGTDDTRPGKKIIKNVPLLLIDDEADNASINTKDRPGIEVGDSVTAINGKIRKILDAFDKSAYVGYTATPFANIFINPGAETPEHGEDLFPRSFIISVKPPSNYIGPTKIFGLDGDPDAGIIDSNALPLVKVIDDYANSFPPGHKKDYVPGTLPESLKYAIRCFILTCAARRVRGQGKKHSSMLVHVTRFIAVQMHVVKLIQTELAGLQRRIEFGDGGRYPSLIEEMEQLWVKEFIPISRILGDESGQPVAWTDVKSQLHSAATKITVVTINGYAKEALDYKEHEVDGRSVIAVGGDKLSRGLTLEGLSISYFLRASRMYDTLMQMGRWFGYRPGYLDLCRLFTTQTLENWYRHIALAETELRREFDYMVAAGLTPENYGLRVRTHPDGMIVTALNKMSHGRTMELSWSGVLAQTKQLPKEICKIMANIKTTTNFLSKLGQPNSGDKGKTRLWHNGNANDVAGFIEALQLPPASLRASCEQLAAFILKQSGKTPSELTNWTVALISNAQTASKVIFSGFDIGLIERNPEAQDRTRFSLKKANILNPEDEGQDFVDIIFDKNWFEEIARKRDIEEDVDWLFNQIGKTAESVALNLTHRWQDWEKPKIRKPPKGVTTRPNGRVLRVLRRSTNGLLLIYPVLPPLEVHQELMSRGHKASELPIIGVALSFPTSETTQGIEYRVNPVYWGTEIEEDIEYED